MNFDVPDEKEAMKRVELALFNERIEQFTEVDLELDSNGGCEALENKIKSTFPEITDPERLTAMKAAISMHFLEKYF
ncbi:MAG: hypothetical protein QG603_290 [Patescibacteria group bacterium]|nr:hypothetical protein [Patescibacteria group bacterium]